MLVQDVHDKSLNKITELSRYWSDSIITPLDVIPVLNQAGVSFVLVGAYGLGGWMNEARATEDVDVVVAQKHVKKAVKALLEAFPHLEADDQEVVTRLREKRTGVIVIDVMKPTQPHLRVIFRNAETVRSKGHEYRIPSLEMAVALKFAPMISLTRAEEDKHQDAHDFIRMVKVNPQMATEKLAELGDLIYPGGGNELLELVRKVRAGEKLNL
ncbi:MAG: hypothetical protein ACJ8FY_16745 [Gemmataceae bacterium]